METMECAIFSTRSAAHAHGLLLIARAQLVEGFVNVQGQARSITSQCSDISKGIEFLFSVHATPSAPLQYARHQYRALDDQDARADQLRLLFLLTDVLIGSFRPQLLALDDRLGEIQLGMLRGVSPEVHHELVKILGILTDGIQELGWYAHDLEDIAEMADVLPGIRQGAQQYFDRHRRRVTRMQENARNIRDQAKDALSHYSDFVAGRQAQVINALTIVATVFLPL
jgi:magnesium transporter